MARVYHQRKPLTDSQIRILTNTFCHCYNAWKARDELHNVLQEKGQSNYHIYKCICKYKDEIVQDEPNKFHAKLKVDPHREILKDISTNLMFRKLNLTIKKGSLRSQYADEYIMGFLVYK